MVEILLRDHLQTVKDIKRRKSSDSRKKNTFLNLIPYVEKRLRYIYIIHKGKGEDAIHSDEYGFQDVNAICN